MKTCEKCEHRRKVIYQVFQQTDEEHRVHVCYECFMSKDFWKWFEKMRKKL